MIDYGKRNLLGVMIDAVDYDAATQRIIDAAIEERRYTVTALAVHGVMTGVFDDCHRHRLNAMDLVVPDGQPVRWGINWLYGTNLRDRVYGPNLMLRVCEEAANRDFPILLFGSTAATLDLLEMKLVAKFPNLRIANKIASQFRKLTEEENADLVHRIRESGARITFSGIGCPRQEVWAYEMGDLLPMPILAVGAAFAFHAGQLSQAPSWMQANGLEWLYRFVCEPVRLWNRYVVLNPAYLFMLSLQIMRIQRFDVNSTLAPCSTVRYG